MTEAVEKVNKKMLQHACRRRGISLSRLAGELGCARQSIYFALERPGRYGPLILKLRQFIQETP